MTGRASIEDLLRDLTPQVLTVLVQRFGEVDACEDAAQEALLAAAWTWQAGGVPANPRGWLVRAAAHRFTDALRSDLARRRREESVARAPASPGGPAYDDALVLLFMCCHPALTPASAVALTLRAVGGLTTTEIASPYLVPEATMAQRIRRAKRRIQAAGARFQVPAPGTEEWAESLRSVLHVLYLIFNEGYAATAGSALHRVELSGEAIRLARALQRMLPHDAEVAGLLALMLLADARRAARTDPDGELVPLGEQDRARWDRRLIAEGIALLAGAFGRGVPPGEYRLQAAIAAVHDQARTADATDWPQIRAVRHARTGCGQPGGHAQPRRRHCHGARPCGWPGPARPHRRRWRPAGRPLPAARRAPTSTRWREMSSRRSPTTGWQRLARPASPSAAI